MKLRVLLLPGALCALAIATFGSCASAPLPPAKATRPAPQSTDQAVAENFLVDRVWLVAGYRLGNDLIPLESEHGSSARLIFRRGGAFEGNTGSNVIAGEWKLSGRRPDGSAALALRITRRGDKPGTNDVAAKFEGEFIRLLGLTRRIDAKKDFIRLRGARDEILLQFVFRDAGGF